MRCLRRGGGGLCGRRTRPSGGKGKEAHLPFVTQDCVAPAWPASGPEAGPSPCTRTQGSGVGVAHLGVSSGRGFLSPSMAFVVIVLCWLRPHSPAGRGRRARKISARCSRPLCKPSPTQPAQPASPASQPSPAQPVLWAALQSADPGEACGAVLKQYRIIYMYHLF